MKQSNFYFTQFLLSLCFKLAYIILAKILTAIPCEILSFIGRRKKHCFANHLLSCYVSLNQALFGCSSLNLKLSRLK